MDTLIPEYFEYRIKAGDSLSMIMAKFYGVGPRSPSYNKILNQILSLNPHIKDPSLIRTGSLLRLMAIPNAAPTPVVASSPLFNPVSTPFVLPSAAMCPAEYGPESFVLNDIPAQDELDFWMLSWLAQNSNYLVIPGSIAAGAKGNLLSPANIGLIEQISEL